jgi:hypothetical protein
MFEVGGGGDSVRSYNAVVSAAESLRARSWAILTVIVDGVGVELGVVEPTRLLEVPLCACAEVAVRYGVLGPLLSQRQRHDFSREFSWLSTIFQEFESP